MRDVICKYASVDWVSGAWPSNAKGRWVCFIANQDYTKSIYKSNARTEDKCKT